MKSKNDENSIRHTLPLKRSMETEKEFTEEDDDDMVRRENEAQALSDMIMLA